MAITLADQYYLKALDGYPFNLEEAIENLNYALSYDSEHSGANHLMGRLYMEKFQNFKLAEEYFTDAMSSNPYNIKACESFTRLMIQTRKYKEALRLLKYAYGIKGIDVPIFMHLEALVYECLKDFDKARELLSRAIQECYDSDFITILEGEIKRIERKEQYLTRLSYRIVD